MNTPGNVGCPRSAALQRAIDLLRRPDLERDYEAAWQEWAAGGDDSVWNPVVDDGLDEASR